MVQWLGPLATYNGRFDPRQVTKIQGYTAAKKQTNKQAEKCYMTYILFCAEFGLSFCMVAVIFFKQLVKNRFVSPNFHKVGIMKTHLYY